MSVKSLPSSSVQFLKAHGAEQAAAAGISDPHGLVQAFRDTAPAPDSDPLSQEHLQYLTAVLDCIGVLDEQLYEHYRALIDLFRAGVFRAPLNTLLAYPTWNELREKGVRLGLLAADLYGKDLPRPHPGLPDTYLRVMEEIGK